MKRYYKIYLCWGTSDHVAVLYQQAEEGQNPVDLLTEWLQGSEDHKPYLFDDNKPIIKRVFDTTTQQKPVIVWSYEDFKHPNGKMYKAGQWYDADGNKRDT